MASKYIMGKTIKETDPERYEAICEDLKAGKSLVQIQRDNNAGSEAVGRIKNELMTAGELKDWKKRTAGKAAALAERMIERMADNLDQIKPNQLSIPAAGLIDKVAMLSDQPSQIVEHRHEIGQGMAGWLGKNTAPNSTKIVEAEIIPEKQDKSSGLPNRDNGEDSKNSQGGEGV